MITQDQIEKLLSCPICGATLISTPDIVDEAIAWAAERRAYVEHVFADSPLREEGHIGALLRFRPVDLY